MKRFQEEKSLGVFDSFSKKEASRKIKQLNRLEHYLSGIQNMRYLPKAIFVVDTKRRNWRFTKPSDWGLKSLDWLIQMETLVI